MVSIPVKAKTLGLKEETLRYPSNTSMPSRSNKCLVTITESATFGPNESGVELILPSPTIKHLSLSKIFMYVKKSLICETRTVSTFF